jgi:DNA-binding MarR family transcriptional regulator
MRNQRVKEAIECLNVRHQEDADSDFGLTLRQVRLLESALEKDPKMAEKIAEMLGLLDGRSPE